MGTRHRHATNRGSYERRGPLYCSRARHAPACRGGGFCPARGCGVHCPLNQICAGPGPRSGTGAREAESSCFSHSRTGNSERGSGRKPRRRVLRTRFSSVLPISLRCGQRIQPGTERSGLGSSPDCHAEGDRFCLNPSETDGPCTS